MRAQDPALVSYNVGATDTIQTLNGIAQASVQSSTSLPSIVNSTQKHRRLQCGLTGRFVPVDVCSSREPVLQVQERGRMDDRESAVGLFEKWRPWPEALFPALGGVARNARNVGIANTISTISTISLALRKGAIHCGPWRRIDRRRWSAHAEKITSKERRN